MTECDRERAVAKFRDLLTFFESLSDNDLEEFPTPYISEYMLSENITEWDNNDTTGQYEISREKSLARLAAISKAIGGHRDKIMDEDGLRLVVTLPESQFKLTWTVDKEVTCTKKVVGKKLIPGRPAQEATEDRWEDEVEWVCDEIVLLKTQE